MANTTTSPNMSLIIPTVGVDPGPDWATNLNASLNIIDQHNHSPGSGVAIIPSGININSDLSFFNNNAIQLRTARFFSQSAALSGANDIGCLYEAGVDLYYNDGNGNQIRITQGGSVTGSAGTITGLPSGTASASYSAGTFTFQSATSTPAAMNVGPVSIGNQVANSKVVTIAPDNSIAANYSITLPPALPSNTGYVQMDTSGNVSVNTNGVTGTGAVVQSDSATLTGTVTFQGQITANDGIHISSQGINITGGILLPDFTVNSWLLVDSSNHVAAYRGTKTLLATDSSGNSVSSVTYFGNTQLSFDVIQTASIGTSIGTQIFSGLTNANKYIWIANAVGMNPVSGVGPSIMDITSSSVSVCFGASNTTWTLRLYGIQYTS